MQIKLLVSSLMLAAVCAAPSFASTITYSATLAGTSEVPANASTATGFETLYLTGNMLTINATFSGLFSEATGAHIHCCAPLGTNTAVVVPYAMFPSVTAGSFTEKVDLSTFAFGGGLTETAFLAGLNSGEAYANIHDAKYPGGEIEGQFAVTPEPGSLMLVATGLVGAAGMLRRKFRV